MARIETSDGLEGYAEAHGSGIADMDRPALVLVGEEDKPYLRAAEVLSTKLPRAQFETIAGAGHIVNIEATDAFNAKVIRFLDGLRAS